MNKLGIDALLIRLRAIIGDLHEHEVIEIKQKGYVKGEISIVVKSTLKEDFCITEKNN